MELDDLKSAWRALDERVVSAHALNVRMFTELKLDKTRHALRQVTWLLWLEIVVALGAAVMTGSFLADHWRSARFAIPALALHGVAIAAIVSAVAQLTMLATLDYAGPVVRMQSTLTELSVRRMREVRWGLLLMFPLWTPLVVVVMQAFFGFDVYRWFGVGWVAANLAFCAAAVPVVIWVVRRWDRRIGERGILRELADDIAGRRLATAIGFLSEVSEFEQEPRS